MRRLLIILACLLWLCAGCGSQTPDSMTAAIYGGGAFIISNIGRLTVTNEAPIIQKEVTDSALVQKIYDMLPSLPIGHAGAKICLSYGEVLTFYSGSTVLAQVFSDPCPSGGLQIATMLNGPHVPTQAFEDLIKQATGLGLEPYTGEPIPTTGS